MHQKDPQVSFSDRELEVLARVATERGMSIEEAADALMHEAIAQRFKERLGRIPAQVYTLKKR